MRLLYTVLELHLLLINTEQCKRNHYEFIAHFTKQFLRTDHITNYDDKHILFKSHQNFRGYTVHVYSI